MGNFKGLLARFTRDENGAAMVEYTIIVGLITAVAIGAILAVGEWIGPKWEELRDALQSDG
jgi:pilus assembly protein Flp/PilA